MAVEALKLIRETEEGGRKILEAIRGEAAEVLKDAEQEISRLKEEAAEVEKSLAVEISERYAKEGETEGKAIEEDARAEVKKLVTSAESNLDSAVNLVLERILRLR